MEKLNIDFLTIEIDFYFDGEDICNTLNPQALKHNVFYVIKNYNGSQCWPRVRIHGESNNVKSFFKEWDGESGGDIYDVIVD